MTGRRLDRELVGRRLLPSRSAARLAIIEGKVVVDGVTATRPARRVAESAEIRLAPGTDTFVSRGAHKLLAALDAFGFEVEGRRAVDVGASTGGFTQVLLEHGATEVVALDVGTGQLHEQLRKDQRVTVHDRTNVRHIDPAAVGSPFDVVVVDLSFISVRLVASVLTQLGGKDTDWMVLVKPQFELGRSDLGKGGVVRSAAARSRALTTVIDTMRSAGFVINGCVPSPVIGGSGNREALLWMRRNGRGKVLEEMYKVLDDE